MEGQTPQDQYIDNALRAVQNKRQIPEIDFTLHTMEDGTQVSTQERVCKGTPDIGGAIAGSTCDSYSLKPALAPTCALRDDNR